MNYILVTSPPNDPTKTWKKKLIEQAEAIIAISESTKSDIIKYTNAEPDRISVVYLGNPFEYLVQSHRVKNNFEHPALEEPYILFVGNRNGYKNFIFFIKSVARLLKKDENLRVYCAGGGPFMRPELEILNELNILSKVRFINTNDLIMKHLYENAQAFIFPSLYEGFGLPILEAFSCGCPALLSNSSSFPRSGGRMQPAISIQMIRNPFFKVSKQFFPTIITGRHLSEKDSND
ncbi:glycosyltransferase family 4 protein [Methanoculleus chikugoensis]|uniref:glycosyltransferase family 4 protein n=1 Tax=Methanoculleus chikugoensis TaxID=118126 RepID=UPI000A6F5E81|nr:glycosyltransferase family 1 protein [Methanoculleus chikugoensis]